MRERDEERGCIVYSPGTKAEALQKSKAETYGVLLFCFEITAKKMAATLLREKEEVMICTGRTPSNCNAKNAYLL